MGTTADADARWVVQMDRLSKRGAIAPRALVLCALGLAALTACAGGGAGEATLSEARGSVASVPAQRDPLAPGGDVGGGTPAGVPARVPIQTRQVISTGDVRLESDNLGSARNELDRLLGRFGGYVSDEETVKDDRGRTSRSVLKIRVPSQYFDRLMASLDDVATVTEIQRKAVDVTTEVIDVEARIRTQEVSLQRLRGFLGKARNVDSIIRLESEISSREAALSSLRAQQKYLDDQTSLATLTLTMTRPGAAPSPEPLRNAGFLAGLGSGWDALVGVLLVAATVLGALTPFTVLLALVGVPVWLWRRAGRRRRAAATPAA